MTIDDIVKLIDGLEGVVTHRAQSGDGSPEIAWGDTFFYYGPNGVVPHATQPFATIVTKDYPGDETSHLDRPGVFRVSVAAGKEEFLAHVGHGPGDSDSDSDSDAEAEAGRPSPDALDVLIAHPVYGSLGWLAVNNPGPVTAREARRLLLHAHQLAQTRYRRRASTRA
jgi:hypothetical protein